MDCADSAPVEEHGRLVLTRSAGQSVAVGDYVVDVLSIRGNQVRLAFRAPRSVQIVRTEIQRTPRHDLGHVIAELDREAKGGAS